MEEAYEDTYTLAEETHPWFVARRELFAWLGRGERESRVLDFGCGSGIFLVHLKSLGFSHLAGVEVSERLRRSFRDPAIRLISQIPDEPSDAIFALDVLEHIDDDDGTLRALRDRLTDGGRLYVSVPAHPFLWSRHDERNQHKRRYRRSELRTKLQDSGFCIERMSYWNMFAFPPMALIRLLSLTPSSSELETPNKAVLIVAGALLRIENTLLTMFPLPIGISLIVTAVKASK